MLYACVLQVGAAPLVELLTAHVPQEVAAASAEGWKRERTEAALAAARYAIWIGVRQSCVCRALLTALCVHPAHRCVHIWKPACRLREGLQVVMLGARPCSVPCIWD
jgi:hypothetical protein